MIFLKNIARLLSPLLLFLLCGCNQASTLTSSDAIPNPTDPASSVTGTSPHLIYELQTSEQRLEAIDVGDILGANCTFGCMTSAGQYVYYEACEIAKPSDNYLKTTIYRLNTDTRRSEPLFEIENNGEPFLTNELRCVNDILFWVYRDADTLKIDYYNISTAQQDTLKEYPDTTIDLILSGDNRFLSWFLPCESGISLYCFDTHLQTDICLTERATTDSPYTRAYINNGIISYLENVPGGRLLIIYDLVHNKEEYSCVLPEDFLLTRLQANSNYAICTDGYSRDSSLFLLNRGEQKFEKITLSDANYHIFSCHLYDDNIFLVSNLAGHLLNLSIDSGVFSDEVLDMNMIQTAISPDGLFYGYNPTKKLIFILDIAS